MFSSTQLLKEQRKYDENVSDLASGIDGIVPFAERVLEGVLYEEELLDGAVRRLYDSIGDTPDFVIDYAKRGPTSMVADASSRQITACHQTATKFYCR
jgi:hypothetical protein